MALWFDQVQHLAQQILEGQGFDAHPLHPLTLLLVEILQLVHGQDAVAIRVHAAEPVLDAGETEDLVTFTRRAAQTAASHLPPASLTWWGFSCLLQI